MDLIVVGLVVTRIVLGLVCWMGYLLFLQNGRLLLRIEALESLAERAAAPSGSLSPGQQVGMTAFDFDLPDLLGGRGTLSQWRGQRLLLTFVDPRCPYSRALLPDLAALPAAPVDGQPMPLVVSTGDPDENRRWMAELAVHFPVLLQESDEVASMYLVDGTPMAYLVDEEGRLASPLAAGAEAVLRLAAPDPGAPPVARAVVADAAEARSAGITRSSARSRLVRDGLAAGTLAPPFRLPRLDGGELCLSELRGRQILLIFSDPACGPCDLLAPKLEELHRRVQHPQVVMISRGDPAVNRAKAAEHGLTFPIVLQRRWEVSREYGMFATPIGYLIDEHGVIASGVAVGADAILNLARPGTAAGSGTWGTSSPT
jgi:peroxiredoxin